MKEPIFIQTSRGDRTNILANFKLLSKESFIKSVKENKSGQYRYGYIDGTVDNLVSMRLGEFEKVFPEQPFTQEEITREFRKEISEKYGKHAIKVKALKILERGGVYLDKNGGRYVYLGLVNRISTQERKVKEETGHGFITEFNNGEQYVKYLASYTEILKGVKSNLVEKIGDVLLEKQYFSKTSSYLRGDSEDKLTLL